MQNQNTAVSPLDKILLRAGTEKLKAEFLKNCQQDRQQALGWINHEQLGFPVLYILLPEIDNLKLYSELSLRNQIALTLCANILKGRNQIPGFKEQLEEKDEFIRTVSRWMLLSGLKYDGLSGEYDQILDITASYLIRVYHDESVLQELVQLTFRRNRKGAYIHDLVWMIFRSRDPRVLKWIAEYLLSANKKDVELANRLLKFSSRENGGTGLNAQNRHASFQGWYRENRPYLNFTSEGFQQSSDPVPCFVNLDAKYLCKKVSPQTGKLLDEVSQAEQNRLDVFDSIHSTEKSLLASYSNRLHSSDEQQWLKWMGYSIDKQIKIAKNGFGGRYA